MAVNNARFDIAICVSFTLANTSVAQQGDESVATKLHPELQMPAGVDCVSLHIEVPFKTLQ